MDSIPDITGFYLDEALQICKDNGYQVSVVFTRPDKLSPEGKPRVVRFQKVSIYTGVITVVLEEGMKGGG
ncbi:MAG TPA: hypothetical protein DCZ10_14445 [Pelotomaculum sp.]|uniref:PASTA domain-containing protein n=1 Tax=Pelotomaculum schinkii TaxID=78350 RepID=A0A4Y7RD25_9FIRM|nr:hypothetical protein [Pelotomaculum schinkii]TEB06732.1 hypothetical protein Psch_00264 [Pelotomaculum schinkii]HBC94055.1 hypothetical protein [Pelotomaculum sp.]